MLFLSGRESNSTGDAMRKILLGALLAPMLIITLAIPRLTQAQNGLPQECDQSSLPSRDLKYPGNQLILICRPANWNGDLIVYVHGYVPPQAPLVLPLEELILPDETFVPEMLLTQGFAFATSSYHKNGVATEQASQDLLDLVNYFESLVPVGSLKRVFIVGASEGGLIAIQLLEQHPNKFDAGVALCAPAGGAPKQIKYAEDFRVVFDYFFPDVFPFGAFDVPADAFTQWKSVYVPRITAAITSDRRATTQLFSVTRAAVDPTDLKTALETAIDVLFYSIWGTPDLIATTGGIPYDNRFTIYLGLTNNLALNLQVERIRGDRKAEGYTRTFYQTTGDLDRPLVTLHNILDPIVPFEHELTYRALVAREHNSRFLTVVPVAGYGHCDFTTEQILGAFALMVRQANVQTH
jgi:pimeloyl-ACP methyl ester carboxylesterase